MEQKGKDNREDVHVGTVASRANADGDEETDAMVNKKETNKKGKSTMSSLGRFIYDPQRKTFMGRSSDNWAKVAIFYFAFYLFLALFFSAVVAVFALMLPRNEPRYYNRRSTMGVRGHVNIGMGFRPQPSIYSNLILITNDEHQQTKIASSLRLFRDVFLLQRRTDNVEECTPQNPAARLPEGLACSFHWFKIVPTQHHPCSDENKYGFAEEKPCVLIKLNKIYGWTPEPGPLFPGSSRSRPPASVQHIKADITNKNANVYVTCSGAAVADDDVLSNLTYYSLLTLNGNSEYGGIPYYYFPFKNAPDHVQPFVLVKFNSLPKNRLITVRCQAWARNINHDTKHMRGMVIFQLYRTDDSENMSISEHKRSVISMSR
ncbi:unnamed protein product [Didymodactylos carnosus]|uniref:Sodium/potassium-transporting ATPase subunit beta-2 n=1 Tax=Didymodactylos carnosus TaxID=1234261 RepID=A0A813UE15_9BILA|nr:unnamed protein product [Didymodactylos carnosus]CAF0822091.1 unnamed protein product [Didymodactylos carnosus]CAF0954435.1 unnamed protein product [Didymodactylos carnosus]CAF3608528.1 unnamed protein product [Didymodactylos carnosus]CAF3608589.1 unnamed protein product [Didymodactylos carnosus]